MHDRVSQLLPAEAGQNGSTRSREKGTIDLWMLNLHFNAYSQG